MENETALVRIHVCADLLAQHTKLHYFSVALSIGVLVAAFTLAGLDALPGVAMYGSVLAVLLGIGELIYAVRVGFDAALLRQLAQHKNMTPAVLTQLDHALIALKLLPSTRAGRDMDARLHGCIELFRHQAICCGLQVLTVLSATLWLVLRVY